MLDAHRHLDTSQVPLNNKGYRPVNVLPLHTFRKMETPFQI